MKKEEFTKMLVEILEEYGAQPAKYDDDSDKDVLWEFLSWLKKKLT